MRIGAIVSVVVVAVATPLLGAMQWLALKTGLFGLHLAPRLWFRLICLALGIRIRVEGEVARGRPLMVVANHTSWTDIMVLGSVVDAYFVARGDLANWPVMGTLSRLARCVFVDRENRRTAGAQTRELAARLASGDPMVLFAEGTCGDGTHVLPFKSTLFGAAQMALGPLPGHSVLVQPAAIAYTHIQGLPTGRRQRADLAWIGDMDLFPHVRRVLAYGAIDVTVAFGEPETFTADNDRKAMARLVEGRVREMAGEMRRGRD